MRMFSRRRTMTAVRIAMGSVVLVLCATPLRVASCEETAPLIRPAVAASDDLLFMVTDNDRPQADVYLWSVAAGRIRQIPFEYNVDGFCFAGDNTRVVFLGAPRLGHQPSLDLFLLDLASTEVRRVTTGFWGDGLGFLAWRPGSDEVAAPRALNRSAKAGEYGDDGLWLINLKDGHMSQSVGPSSSGYPCCGVPWFSDDGAMLACQREGRYTAVMDVTEPARWSRLDRPPGANHDFLMDLVWGRGDHTLWLACTAAVRFLLPGRAKGKGPGGIWRWNVAKSGPTTAPPPGDDDPELPGTARDDACAVPMFEQGRSVYALALSQDGQRLAYLNDSGIWMRNLRDGVRTRLAAMAAFPELRDVGRAQEETESGLVPVHLSWSATDRYISVLMNGWGSQPVLRVIAVGSHAILDAPRRSRIGTWVGAAWRPAPANPPGLGATRDVGTEHCGKEQVR